MRIAFIGYEVPNTEHSTVTYSAFLFIKAMKDVGYNLSVVILLPEYSIISDTATRQRWIRELKELGVQVHILSGDPPQNTYRYRGARRVEQIRYMVWPRIIDYFPYTGLARKMTDLLAVVRPDVIFLYGYEAVAATQGLQIAPRIAFIGDPVHLPGLYRQYPPFVAKRSPISPSLLLSRLRARQQSRMMIRLLSRCDAVTAAAAHHAEWFRLNGLPHCKYMPSLMVPDWGGSDWQNQRDKYPPNDRFKIVLMGHVTGTATLAGLYLLADETLPILEQVLGDSFEIHICGKGKFPADLSTKLDRPSVRLRGFVDDVISELLTCDIFLVPTPIKLGIRTRIIYAWSVGCCVVSHESNALGLAEMVNEENALLAADGQSLAQTIIRAYNDPDLRLRLRLGGRKTYETSFSSEILSGKFIAEFEHLVCMKQ